MTLTACDRTDQLCSQCHTLTLTACDRTEQLYCHKFDMRIYTLTLTACERTDQLYKKSLPGISLP